MGDDALVNIKYENELTKNDLVRLLQHGDHNISLVAPEKFKSAIWERFRIVHYKGVKLDFVQCIGCYLVLMYKSRTGTASLLRHRCTRFPISVQDQKQEAAGRYSDVMSEMASSSFNNTIEPKQEILTDEESIEMEMINGDQQYTTEQTNKGLMESFSLLEKSFMTVDEAMLSREDVEIAQRNNDPSLFFERPRNHRHSSTWDRFEIVYYRDVRQNFAKCLSCGSIVSYKKTTGTASLIRHKCKMSKTPMKPSPESLINLLTQAKTPPTLTPAPVFDAPSSSSSSTAVSSTATIKQPMKSEPLLKFAEENLAFAQINWLCESIMSSQILSDPAYLLFIQNLVNFGADFGKQNVSQIINRKVICEQMIPKKYEYLQAELINVLKDTEFSISFHKWTNSHEEGYVTVVGYFFTENFEYRNHFLGTKKCERDEDVMTVVKYISDGYKVDHDVKLKCIFDGPTDDFESFPCIVGQFSNVIMGAIEATADSKEFFKKLYIMANDQLDIPIKNAFKDATNDEKMKTFLAFHKHLKTDDNLQNDSMVKKFSQQLGSLFSAIVSLTEASEKGERHVTANKVYLWIKKLLRLYASMKTDENAASILKAIKAIKVPEIYQVAVFLDPNFKNLKFLETSERAGLLEIVKKNLQRMMVDDETIQPPTKKHRIEDPPNTRGNDNFLEFMDFTMESVDDQVNSEIQCYMGFKLENPVEVIEFWRENQCFPYLKKLARNFLNLPSCTFHSNCCFLGASNELYLKFKNLSGEDIETFTFLHQNF